MEVLSQQRSQLARNDYWLVMDDRFCIAHEVCRSGDGSITANLYRNLKDYEVGRVMETNVTYWL